MAYKFQSIIEAGIGTRGKNLEAVTEAKVIEEPGTLFLACSACFIMPPGTTYTGMALPTVDETCQHQSPIKKMTHSLTYRPSDGDNSSRELPSSR